MKPTADVLIVGSGAAGLTAALNLAETRTVAVIAFASFFRSMAIDADFDDAWRSRLFCTTCSASCVPVM